MNNLEKLLIFISDVELMDDMTASLERLVARSNGNNLVDVRSVKAKLKNIKKLCQEKL